MATPTPKARFLDMYEREHATTLKVLRAYPAPKADFKPHERSNSALALAWTFVIEEGLMIKGLKHQELFGDGGFPKAPDSWEAVLSTFNAQHEEFMALLKDPSNQQLEGKVGFFTGPKQMGEYPLEQFLSFMLCDQIHHRGQMSVYLRMAGGKVPSIYGPSADEPWM